MRKIIPLFILLIIAAYSGLWYYAASKTKEIVERELASFKAADTARELMYDKVETTGFPLGITIEIIAPRINFKESASSQGNISQIRTDKITARPDLLVEKLTFTVIGDMAYSFKENNQDMSQSIHCAQNPALTTGFDTSLLSNKITTHKELAEHLKTVSYRDQGCAVTNLASKTVISRSERTSFDVQIARTADNDQVVIAFDAKAIERLDTKDTAAQKFGKSNINANINLLGTLDPAKKDRSSYKEGEVTIKNLDFTSDKLNIMLSGKLNSTNSNMMPSGEVRVKIDQYPNLVNYVTTLTDYTNTEQINTLLKRASAQTEKPDSVDIVIKGDKTGIMFGNLSFGEVLGILSGK
jgi:hypothetical protein